MQSVGNAFVPAYLPIVHRRGVPTASENVSFNYTGVGGMLSLISFMIAVRCLDYKGGRAESILMSMPPLARWNMVTFPHAIQMKRDYLSI